MDLQLAGRTALVTGASIGIGRGIALALAREGVRLAVCARRSELLETLAGEITSAGGHRPVLIVEDLMAEGAPERIASAALAGLGAVDILVNNAGGSRPFKVDAGEDLWHEAMTLNFTRQRQLAHRLLDQMVARKWGRIVSITGKSEPEGLNGAFCAKAAMHAWSKGLSREVGRHGITVNCIPPGRIMSEQIERNYTPEYRKWQSEHEIPIGRYGEPEDIAHLVCFLASPLAGYISGTVIPVDGSLRRYQFWPTAIGKTRATPALAKALGNYPALAREAHARIKGSTLVTFPDLGHSPQVQDPPRFNGALLEGLRKLP